MNVFKIVFLSLLIVLASLSATTRMVWADSTCGGYFYGGPCVEKEILVDKLVKDPASGNFVDNLGPSDSKLNPEEEITFKIVVKNTGNTDLEDVKIKDVLPNYLDFVSGPEGTNWNSDERTFEFVIDGLKAGETKEFKVKAKVVSKESLPEDKSLVCVTNWVEAKAEGMVDSDTSGVCIQNVEQLPATGADPVAIASIFALGVTGLVLVKKGRRI